MSQRLCHKYDRARSRFYEGRKREASAYTWDENVIEYYQVVVPMSEGEEVIYLDVQLWGHLLHYVHGCQPRQKSLFNPSRHTLPCVRWL